MAKEKKFKNINIRLWEPVLIKSEEKKQIRN